MKFYVDPTKWFAERPLLICLAFGALSVLATLHNKFIFSRHIVDSSNVLLLIQNLVTITALTVLRKLKILEFEVNIASVGDWLCGLAYAASVVSGLWSLVFVNVVMFGALKRWTTLVSWAIEYRFTPTETTMKCLPPLILMMIGTIGASLNDFQFSFIGYSLALLSCVAQGAAYELGRRVARRNKGVCAVLYSNSVVALIVLTVILTCTGDLWRAISSNFGTLPPQTKSAVHRPTRDGFLLTCIHLCLNAATCLFMNYFIFLNCFVNSPLAHSVTGNMKVVVTTAIGGIVFGFSLNFLGAIGLFLNMISGFWFSAVKLKAKVDKNRRERSIPINGIVIASENERTRAAGPSDAPPKIVSTFGGSTKHLLDSTAGNGMVAPMGPKNQNSSVSTIGHQVLPRNDAPQQRPNLAAFSLPPPPAMPSLQKVAPAGLPPPPAYAGPQANVC